MKGPEKPGTGGGLSMSIARRLLRVLDPFLGWPLLELARLRGLGVVALYHRISAEDGPDYPPLSPEVFGEHLDLLAELFDVLPLAEFVERLAGGRSLKGCCALTFDDGYADFFTDALPLLEEKGLPVSHFLVVDSLLTGRPPWNARLARLLRLDPSLSGGRPSQLIDRLSRAPWLDRDAILSDWEGRVGTSGDHPPRMISETSLSRLLVAGVEVGAHTLSHSFLTRVTPEEAARELKESRTVLEDLCGRPIRFASYPQGLHDRRVELMARDAGFEAAFSVGQRPAERASNPFAIPRFDVTDKPRWMLRLELSGFVPWLRGLRGA